MPKARPASTADDFADNIRSLVDRVVDAKLTHEMTKRGQDIGAALAERTAEVGVIAGDAWRETRPVRRDATRRFWRATADAAKWSDTTWRQSLRPTLRDLWKQRALAVGAAGAAIPASREIVDTAAVRMGLKRREDRHWGAFFLGILLGAAAGAVIALLTTPKRGSEMRHELATRADDLASKARESEWVPIFQRETNGHTTLTAPAMATGGAASDAALLEDAAAEAGAATGPAADQAAADTAEAINEAYEPVDRESPA